MPVLSLSGALAQLPLSTVAAAAVAGCAAYLLGVVVYRLYFHPLAKYPGPLLARVSDIYGVYHAYRGDRHLNQFRQHQKYGDIVRLAPDFLCINRPEALRDLYRVDKNVKKSRFYKVMGVKDEHGQRYFSIVATQDKAQHAVRRRAMGHAFSDQALREFEPNVHQVIDQWLRELGSQEVWQGNIAKWSAYITYDIMGELVFGKDMGMLGGADRDIPDALDGLVHSSLFRGAWPRVDTLRLVPLFFPQIMKRAVRFGGHAKQQLLARLDVSNPKADVMSHLLHGKQAGKQGINTLSMESDARALIIAGTDTTAVQLAASFYYLTRNPAALARLTAELRRTFASPDDIRMGPALNGCEYLRAVVDETLRMSPSVPSGVYREAMAGGATVAGEHLPAGTEMVAPTYTLQHDATRYPEPFKYRPERWLAAEVGEAAVQLAESTFAPFSLGSRGCIGRRLAYAELYLVLAKTLWTFEPRYVEGGREMAYGEDIDEYHLVDHFTAHVDGPTIEFTRRTDV